MLCYDFLAIHSSKMGPANDSCNLLHQMAEYRISIYGRKKSEWDQMASWIVNNELYSENVVWLIQVDSPPSWVQVCSLTKY